VSALRYLLVSGWAVWLGSIVFFSFVVAPTTFHALGREAAAPLLRAVFPRYYLVGLLSGAAMLAAALGLGAGLPVTIPIVVGLVIVAYVRQVVTPAVNRARERGDDDAFARLHLVSVQLNLVVLAVLLLLGTIVAGLARV